MSKDPKYHTVAKAVKLERVDSTGEVFVTFRIINEDFKQRLQKNWLDDVELELIIKEK
ncbi:MAG TPA: hypothetical protein VKN14_03055 [Flavobacteriaceae bacterium]|nr:hypothetical protein [Flavobacteriaceae bacterium]